MARATLKLKRPITQFELDLDENSLEAVGFIRMPEAKTNADRFRAMTDEELAYFIAEPSVAPPPWCKEIPVCPHLDEDIVPCHECALDWLKEEGE